VEQPAVEFTMRRGTDADFDVLYDIWMEPGVNRYLNFEIMPREEFRKLFGELLQGGSLYVYEADGQVVATCIVTRQPRRAQHVATLGTLATHPQFQGRGIGTRFMKELVGRLKEEGVKRIDLCAEADNPAALAFYKKLGFEPEGVLKKYFIRQNESHYVDEHLMALIVE
jgi:ribosomal protein S18 acetylase RimI-like enzyme